MPGVPLYYPASLPETEKKVKFKTNVWLLSEKFGKEMRRHFERERGDKESNGKCG